MPLRRLIYIFVLRVRTFDFLFLYGTRGDAETNDDDNGNFSRNGVLREVGFMSREESPQYTSTLRKNYESIPYNKM